ncbi:MAG TPA: 16S rRNA (cytosine(1402)-N(4))-methyltransferase RsmH [Thermoanaerobaculia bacterium]|nr:16S rRNA (cytosine(1402)-N(4))-methyltransferase RsmH [Thermoanaerobaculia bacterium]
MDVQHVPVLLAESLERLAPERGGTFVDATLGLGGHAEALLAGWPEVELVGIDRDPQALEQAARRLAPFGSRVRMVQANFHQLDKALAGLGVRGVGSISGVLADLGVSSLQLDTAERGFSFRFDGPLDMRMGLAELTAADVVNQASEEELEKIFRDYGEERQARRIARAIGRARLERPIETTGELRQLVGRVARAQGGYKPWGERIDPATRVFQALRIEVNQELEGLEAFIQQAVDLMETDGRLVIISYHSLEDRIVKNTLRGMAQGEVDQVTGRPLAETQMIEVLTRKPLRPSEKEVNFNPRSRSARLRAARRL